MGLFFAVIAFFALDLFGYRRARPDGALSAVELLSSLFAQLFPGYILVHGHSSLSERCFW